MNNILFLKRMVTGERLSSVQFKYVLSVQEVVTYFK